jgi:hypothetical protein
MGRRRERSWSRSTTRVLKDTKIEERDMCMLPSVAKKTPATIKRNIFVDT